MESSESIDASANLLKKDAANNLLFAVPKKGRIFNKTMDLLKGADIKYVRKSRFDIAYSSNLPITLVFLPAKDIARFVGDGNVDLGITGQDMIQESGLSEAVDPLLDLGFGKCNLQIQVPITSNYQNARDLIGKRIVTSFVEITKKLFMELETVAVPENLTTKISYVSGSVEAACALGLADGIVDLVESGETMRAANLKAIHTITSTQSVLICNRKKHSQKNSARSILIEKIFKRIRGVIEAQQFVLVNYNISQNDLAKAVAITPGKKAPSVSKLDEGGSYAGWNAVSAMVQKEVVVDVMDKLELAGATDIIVLKIYNCRT